MNWNMYQRYWTDQFYKIKKIDILYSIFIIETKTDMHITSNFLCEISWYSFKKVLVPFLYFPQVSLNTYV